MVVNLHDRFSRSAARCTHAGAPLDDGSRIGDVLAYPWYGSSFRVTDGIDLKGTVMKPLGVHQSVAKGDYLYGCPSRGGDKNIDAQCRRLTAQDRR